MLFNSTAIGFAVLTVMMYVWLLKELKRALEKTPWEASRKKKIYKKVLYALLGWAISISVLSMMGFFHNFSTFPPRFMLVLVVPLVIILILTFSKTTKELLSFIPAKNIIRLQVFRVFVEILLWLLFLQNIAPVQMSFEGRNFDVLTGLSAPFIAYLLSNNRTALLVWNILGLVLLVNIVTIAILSLPTPFRVFMNEPANTIVTRFPFVWLPGLLVPLAYGLHFLSLRQLAINKAHSK